MLAKAPVALSSSLHVGHSLLQNASSSKIVALAAPRLKKVGTSYARGRLFSEFHGARVVPVESVAHELKRSKSWPTGARAFSNAGEESLRKSEDLDGLKASQIKKVRAATSFLMSELNWGACGVVFGLCSFCCSRSIGKGMVFAV